MDDTEASELAELLETLRRAVIDENLENLELAIQTIKKMPTPQKNWLLSEAATEKRLVELLLDNEADVDAGVGDGEVTPLAKAASINEYEVVRVLIDHKARVDTVDKTQETTALGMAAGYGNKEMAELLLNNGADPNGGMVDGEVTPLARAAWTNRYEVVKLLIEHKARVDTVDKTQETTALGMAAFDGYKETVELLLDNGADPNGGVGDGEVTPLARAAWTNKYEAVKLLIDHKARVDTVDYTRKTTVLEMAVFDGYKETVELLLDNGANPNAWMGDGWTPLAKAAWRGNKEMVELLLNKNADPNPRGKRGMTALRMAIRGDEDDIAVEGEAQEGIDVGDEGGSEQGEEKENLDEDEKEKQDMDGGERMESDRVKIVKILLAKGASVHGTKGESGQNILHYMSLRRSQEDFDLFDLLLEKSTARGFNARDASGSTPLHFAVRRKNLAVVKSLVKKRVNLQIEDTSGKTALQAAFQEWLKSTPKGSSINTPQPAFCKPASCTLKKILKILLENGARTDGFKLKDIARLRELEHDTSSEDIVMLHDDLSRGIHISDIEPLDLRKSSALLQFVSGGKSEYDKKVTAEILICLGIPLSPEPSTKNPSNNKSSAKPEGGLKGQTGEGLVELPPSFVHPKSFLRMCRELDSNISGVHWAWSTVTNGDMSFRPKIPDLQDIISLMPVEVILIGYACFKCPIKHMTDSNNCADEGIQAFEFINEKVEISWIMKKDKSSTFLRSVQYRGSLDLQYLAIPQNAVQFVTLFLGDIHERWKKVLGSAKEYLVHRRDSQLRDAGREHETITLLLKDSQRWSQLRKSWKTNLECARKLRDQLRESDILFPEVKNAWQFRKEHESATEIIKGEDVVKRGPGGNETVDLTEEQPKSMPTSNPDTTGPITVAVDTPVSEQQKARLSETGEANKGPELEGTADEPSLGQKTRGATAEESSIPAVRRRETLRLEVVEGDKQKGPRSPIQPKIGVPNIDRDEAKKNALRDQKSEKPKEGQEKPKENELNILAPDQVAKLPAMKRLSEVFDALVKECEDGIAELEKETTDMIQLEFNLISIYEARRSIETSVSMKRLSWITFIFLPLMFITGVFGMNVNLFQSEAPRWQWYFVVVVPFSLLVLSVWILCKYLPGVGNLEKRLDKFLKNVFDRGESKVEIRQNPTRQSPQRETITGDQASKGARPLKKALRSRLPRWRRNKGLDPESGNGSTTAVTEEHIEEKK